MIGNSIIGFISIYKKNYENEVGLQLRNLYERAKIQTEQDFKEAMNDVLSNR